ncbi:MAG: tripartite tricarboxylate transporter substrate binding protein [Burkholderiales bacterium]|nr:tripartite tricarboxylate transporter substrate binding protein [Burkholderiales bacterium]
MNTVGGNSGHGRRHARLAALAAAGATSAVISSGAPAQDWKPTRPVELIATNAPGGGSDRILRIFVKILGNHVPTPVNVVNRPGGGGAVAYNYANQHPGDGHYLVMGSRSLLTNNIAGHGPSYLTLTPAVHLFTEFISVNVKPVSPIRTGRDLIAFMKRDPSAVSYGIATSLGGPNHQGAAAALKAAGFDIRKMKNVIFPSGGAASTALLGGHIDVVPLSVAFGAQLVRNKQVRMIAVTSPRRLGGVLADVPTWKEQGANAEVSQWRIFVGPRDMTPAQLSYWEQTLRKATEAPEWKKELAENYWRHLIMGHSDTMKFLERDNADAKAFLMEIGLAR